MISQAKIERIRRLLAANVSIRRIARRMGVSRSAVRHFARVSSTRAEGFSDDPRISLFAEDGPATRCPTCGGLVYMPCMLCQVRSLDDGQRMVRRRVQARAAREALMDSLRRQRVRRQSA